MQYTIYPKAYGKIVYHCAKYPHTSVNGVLIGSFAKKDNRIIVQDSIPLFHNDLNLSLMLEVALSQVEIYADSKGLSIVGYYIANASNQDNSLTESVKCIGNKMSSNSEQSCVLLIDNEKIFTSHAVSSLKLYTKSEQSSVWKESTQSLMLDGGSDIVQKILTSVQNGVHTKLVDFGCHLDSIDKDWTNPAINISIDGMIA